MSNTTTSAPDLSAQRQTLLLNVAFCYLPVACLVCACLIHHDLRSTLGVRLNVDATLGATRARGVHSALRLLAGALILRMSWLGLLAEDAWGKLSGPSCYTGPSCAGQIFHSALNRFAALLYFLFLCRIGPCVGHGGPWTLPRPRRAPSAPAPESAPASPKGGRTPSSSWRPPPLSWDMSLLATDFFLAALQVVVLILSWTLPSTTLFTPVYEAYQWQVSALAFLCAAWFIVFGVMVLWQEATRGAATFAARAADGVGEGELEVDAAGGTGLLPLAAGGDGGATGLPGPPSGPTAEATSTTGKLSSYSIGTVATAVSAVSAFSAGKRKGAGGKGSDESAPLLSGSSSSIASGGSSGRRSKSSSGKDKILSKSRADRERSGVASSGRSSAAGSGDAEADAGRPVPVSSLPLSASPRSVVAGNRTSSALRRRGAVHVSRDELHTTPWGKAAASARGCCDSMRASSSSSWRGSATMGGGGGGSGGSGGMMAGCCRRRGRGGMGFSRAARCASALTSAPSITASSCFVIAALFLLRVALFLYTPLSGSQLRGTASAVLYPQFFYSLPETLPPLLILHVSMPGGLLNARRWYSKA